MNPGQYQRRPEVGLSTNLPYDATFFPQPPYQIQSHHGLPDMSSDQQQQQVPTWTSPGFSVYNVPVPMSNPYGNSAWSSSGSISNPEDSNITNSYYAYHSSAPYSGYPQLRQQSDVVPRTFDMSYERRMLGDTNVDLYPYESSSYTLGTAGEDIQSPGLVYDPAPFARMSISPNPKQEYGVAPTQFSSPQSHGMPQCEGNDDGRESSRETTVVEGDDSENQEPYAKLIWRALMGAPGHSMVLQEIYQWFRDNTTKGDADGKGWMNSIRHNLSMNAAFKKTERKAAGDETKKSTEWVLEPFAVKDGVQSTTRYRKGTGAKKFIRSDTPAPSRHGPVRAGGITPNQNPNKRPRAREEHFDPRPAPMIKTDSFRPAFPSQIHRNVSPLTPAGPEVLDSPYYLKTEPETGLDEVSVYQLDNVQGVYMGGDSPLFTNDYDSAYHSAPSMYASRC